MATQIETATETANAIEIGTGAAAVAGTTITGRAGKGTMTVTATTTLASSEDTSRPSSMDAVQYNIHTSVLSCGTVGITRSFPVGLISEPPMPYRASQG